MTTKEIEEGRELLAAATPVERWTAERAGISRSVCHIFEAARDNEPAEKNEFPGGIRELVATFAPERAKQNAEAIVWLRNNAERLLYAAEREIGLRSCLETCLDVFESLLPNLHTTAEDPEKLKEFVESLREVLRP